MALNASGPISLAGSTTGQSIAVELGQSATGTIALNDSNVRALAGKASGAISMPTDFWGKSSAYLLTRSLRFRASASPYIYRTYGTPTNNTKFTWSGWVKRGRVDTNNALFGNADDNTSNGNVSAARFETNGTLQFFSYTGGYDFLLTTTQVFRDPSSWYHIIVACDSSLATASERIKIYVNGTQITAFSSASYPGQNHNFWVNLPVPNFHGAYFNSSLGVQLPFDGYIAELRFIDGQQLTPSSFGETSSTFGTWQPKQYTGTYGNNGFYLPFTNTTSTTTLVADSSGNGNNFTPINISLTPGVTYDSMTDVPTLTSATAANYAVLSPLRTNRGTVTNGNLTASHSTSSYVGFSNTFAMRTGKWYWEVVCTSIGFVTSIGITNSTSVSGIGTGMWSYHYDGSKYIGGSNQAYSGNSYASGDVLGFAFDADAGSLTCYKNNVSQGVLVSGLPAADYYAYATLYGSWTLNFNFGQRPFSYTPPAGFVALNTFNLTNPTIGTTSGTLANKYFDATLYTGNGASNRSVGGLNFQPDFMWNKSRSNAYGHKLYDAVRGVTKQLASQLSDAETTTGTSNLVSFDSNGVTIGNDTGINGSGSTFVNWYWNGGGSTVTDNSGSISSQVRANTVSGFSIVTYTGNGTNATVGHGLGASPSMIIVKKRSASDPWPIYHITTGVQQYFFLNTADSAYNNLTNYWGSSAPSSTTFGLGPGYGGNNSNGATYIAYCFAEVPGFSKIGSYTGNGSSDGPFLFCGFRPRFVIIKSTTFSGADWVMYDAARNTYNFLTSELNPNSSASENNFSGAARMDFTSNGIKLRTSGAGVNNSGSTYIFIAFAESPFKYANAR